MLKHRIVQNKLSGISITGNFSPWIINDALSSIYGIVPEIPIETIMKEPQKGLPEIKLIFSTSRKPSEELERFCSNFNAFAELFQSTITQKVGHNKFIVLYNLSGLNEKISTIEIPKL